MAGLIPQSFIDDLLSRIDIVEVIDSHIPLKKTGREYNACCPFHSEKTPSFTVSPAKQFYHCFGCGASGTAITFLMEYGRMDFVEVIESLASQQGMEVPRRQCQSSGARQTNQGLYDLLEQVSAYYHQQLKHNRTAIDYLKNRGISGESAAEYSLGYAPPGWNNLIRDQGMGKRSGLLKSGMLAKNNNGDIYDRFRERIMFPIRDRRGRIIGFGGRIIEQDAAAKYLNSPDTPIFHKGRELYGLYEALKATRKLKSFYVVEGYMDVITLAQSGMRNAVATMGTAITQDQMKKLLKIAPEIVFCFDGDRAGRSAAWRALESALPVMRDGHMMRFLFLPDGEDPDSMIRQYGKAKFERLAGESQTLSEYFFNYLEADINLSTLDGRSQLARQAQPLLQKLPGGVFNDLMLSELAERTQLSAERLTEITLPEQKSASTKPIRTDLQKKTPIVRHLITLLLQQPTLARLAHDIDDLPQYNLPGTTLLAELISFLQNRPNTHLGVILEHWRDNKYGTYLSRLAQYPVELEEHRLEAEFTDTFRQLGKYHPLHPNRILEKIKQGFSPTDEEKNILRQPASDQ